MVFEQLYPPKLLLQKPAYAFVMGVAYSVLGVGLAMLLFPNDPALIAVAITAILFLPSLGQLSSQAERRQRGGRALADETVSFARVYLAAFFGIFLTFTFFSAALPSLAANALFKRQLEVLYGAATFTLPLLKEIFVNNLLVFMLCFAVSLLVGNGAIFIIAWNASVWGTIFGSLARTAGQAISGSTTVVLLVILVTVLPHVILEILAYIAAVMSGTVISDGLVKERLGSTALQNIIRRNLGLLAIGLGILVLAAVVETVVLDNVHVYAKIAQLAFGQ